MRTKIRNIVDNNLYLLLFFSLLQILSFIFDDIINQIIGSQDPVLYIVFIFGIYFGYTTDIFIHYPVIIKKLVIIVLAVIISYFLYNIYYAFFISGNNSFFSEIIISGGYSISFLGMSLLLIFPAYIVGILFGRLINKFVLNRVNN